MSFDAEAIRGYAVKAVTDFVTNGTPLSEGIAKIANEQELNPEQIKRVVEASNTVAHLKLLSGSPDRTFEFPVAKYETVLGHMVQPEIVNTSKVDYRPTGENNTPDTTSMTGENIKYAMDVNELTTYVAKATIALKADLEKIAYDKQVILLDIEDAINKLKAEGSPLEKLAEVATEKEFNIISQFFPKEQNDGLTKKASLFVDKELDSARNLVGLIKQAENLIQDEMEKSALLPALAGAVGRGLGYIAGIIPRAVGRRVLGAAKTTGQATADIIKKRPTGSDWAKLKSRTNLAVNLGLGAASLPETGSVWRNLQK